jgi:hypothetical protein
MSSLRARLGASLALALVWRYACHSAMVALSLWSEPRPAPPLRDLVLDAIPRNEWVLAHNYQLWAALYLPLAVALIVRDRAAGLRFLWVGGWLSLLRGVCVPLTGLGPPDGRDVNAGASPEQLWQAWKAICNPFAALGSDVARLGLTKDLFFSGHTASTWLLCLYCWPFVWLRRLSLGAHCIVVASVFASHLHYTIDVVGAWALTTLLFLGFERGLGVITRGP